MEEEEEEGYHSFSVKYHTTYHSTDTKGAVECVFDQTCSFGL